MSTLSVWTDTRVFDTRTPIYGFDQVNRFFEQLSIGGKEINNSLEFMFILWDLHSHDSMEWISSMSQEFYRLLNYNVIKKIKETHKVGFFEDWSETHTFINWRKYFVPLINMITLNTRPSSSPKLNLFLLRNNSNTTHANQPCKSQITS